MSGTVFAVTSGKGGVGKTTTALNLGVALRGRGNSVAIIDADLGMANLGRMLGVEHEATLHDVLAGTATLEAALVEEVDDFAVVTGDRDLRGYADADPEAFPALIEPLRDQYDYVILDTGAGLGYEDVLPIDVADEVILVTTPDPAALDDVVRLHEVSTVIDARVRGLLLNRATPTTDVESIFERVGVDPVGVIPEDPAIGESTAAGVPIERYDQESPGAAAYRRLAGVVIGEEEPLLSVAEEPPAAGGHSEEAATTDAAQSGSGETGTAAGGGGEPVEAETAEAAVGTSSGDTATASDTDRASESAADDSEAESGPTVEDDSEAAAETPSETAAESDTGDEAETPETASAAEEDSADGESPAEEDSATTSTSAEDAEQETEEAPAGDDQETATESAADETDEDGSSESAETDTDQGEADESADEEGSTLPGFLGRLF